MWNAQVIDEYPLLTWEKEELQASSVAKNMQ